MDEVNKMVFVLNSTEIGIIIEALKFHADIYANHTTKADWVRTRYNLIRDIKQSIKINEIVL